MSRATTWFALIAAIAAYGCSSGTEPSSQTVDPNALVNEMSLSSLQGLAAVGGAPGPAPALPTPNASACIYASASQSFVCPTVTVNGMTLSMSYTLLDATGHPVAVPSKSVVDAIRTVTDMSGTTTPVIGSTSGPITMTRHQDETLSGLLSGSHVLNGTGSSTMTSSMTVAGASQSSTYTEVDTTLNIVPPAAGASVPFPTAGTMITDETGTGLFAGVAFTMRIVMTFHSDGTAALVITTAVGDATCTVNLRSPAVAPVCSGSLVS